jgi:pyruvate/2-oxoglutarate dehydrogenase complex dihydrolipoamide acyltransferase (E2) component
MNYIFELPDVGEGVVEAELVSWFVSIGDTISADQPVCEVMTDKASMEINCPKGGTVTSRFGEEGDIIPVHSKLLELNKNGAAAQEPAKQESKKPAPQPKKKSSKISIPAAKKKLAGQTQPTKPSTEKVLAAPAVRAFASKLGVNLTTIVGTGKGGRITREDVESATGTAVHTDRIIAPPAIKASVSFGEDKEVKIIGLRRKIAEKMVESVQRAPHFTYVDEVDATELVTLRNNIKNLAAERGVKLTYIPFIMKALVSVFREFPTVNSIMNEDKFAITVRGEVNIGIATDTPQGLYVPVIKNVESKSILELAAEIADITARTRSGQVQLSELQGGTFTITSVGNIGGRFATPIINHPEVAILGVNQIHDRPMVIDGQVVPRKMMYLSPSFDHRVIDGAVAARFVSALKKILEQPASLLLELR